MNELLNRVLQAHGGLERWRSYNQVSARFISRGGLLPMKGLNVPPTPLLGIATIHDESTLIRPYGDPDSQMRFTPKRVVIETTTGKIIEERSNPRAAFQGHVLHTPWRLHRAYFNGYARWTYLNTPFLLAMPGFEVTEIAPWKEGNEVWRVLRARFPDWAESHSKEQEFYFGPDNLLRRHDYRLEIAGGAPIAQYVYDMIEADGFYFPTQRCAYIRTPQSEPIHDLLLIAIDISDFHVEK